MGLLAPFLWLAAVLVAVVVVVVVVGVLVLRGRVAVTTAPVPPRVPPETWVQRAGWSYLGTDPTIGRGWRGWPFMASRTWVASDVCTGSWAGRRAWTFRYTRPEGGPRHVTALELPVALPFLELIPHHAGQVVIRADLPVQDLDLESAAFNRHWRVATTDARFAHAFLHPRLMERLLAPDAEHLSVSVDGERLVCWSDAEPEGAHIEQHLALLTAVADAVPDFVWQDHGPDPGTAA